MLNPTTDLATLKQKNNKSEFDKYGYRGRLYQERLSLLKNEKLSHSLNLLKEQKVNLLPLLKDRHKSLSDKQYEGQNVGQNSELRNFARLKLLIFQLISDYQYTQFPIDNTNKKIILTCVKAGGCGDIAHTFLCAELIQKKFPDCKIKIVIECPLRDEEKVKQLFPTDRFETQFLPELWGTISEYLPELSIRNEKIIKQIQEEDGYFMGIAVPIRNVDYFKPGANYRTIREYGHGFRWDTNSYIFDDFSWYDQAMGFDSMEEGLNFPLITSGQLDELHSPWLKNALQLQNQEDALQYQKTRKLFHVYIAGWSMQALALYSIAAIEKQSKETIDILIPLRYSLANLIQLKVIDLDYLKKNNIGKLIYIKENNEPETIVLGEGKTMQIMSGFIPKHDMEIIEAHSQPFFGCTGNCSLSMAFVANKLPFYDCESTQGNFMETWQHIISGRKDCPTLLAYHNFIMDIDQKENKIYEEVRKNNPLKRFFMGGGDEQKSNNLNEPISWTSKTIPYVVPLLLEYADKIADFYLNSPLLEEAQHFNAYVVENFKFEPRLIEIAHRGLLIKKYPELLEFEQQLCQQFIKGEISEEAVVEKMNQQLFCVLSTIQNNKPVFEKIQITETSPVVAKVTFFQEENSNSDMEIDDSKELLEKTENSYK